MSHLQDCRITSVQAGAAMCVVLGQKKGRGVGDIGYCDNARVTDKTQPK